MPKRSRRAALRDYLLSRPWTAIGKAEWDELRRELPSIAENSLREMLWESGLEIRPPYCGVRRKSLDELERSLLDLQRVYGTDPAEAAICRKLVIQAKDRARFAVRNPKVDEHKRALKEEMVRWMLVWLEDPSMFEPWVRRRKAVLEEVDRLHRDSVPV